MINPFFENKGPKKIEDILVQIKAQSISKNTKLIISDIKDLLTASNEDISFLHSKKYEAAASKTKACCCITTKQLSHLLPLLHPNFCQKIELARLVEQSSIFFV